MGLDWEVAKAAGLWTWSPSQWLWSPDHLRWSLGLGLPKAPVFFDVSTDPVPPAARYEMWRTLLYYSFEGDPLTPDVARDFSARTQCVISDPVQLLRYRSSAVSGHGLPADRANDRETYTIGIVIEGERIYEQEGCAPVTSRAGDFFVFDNRWPSRVSWSDHQAIQVSVARAEIERRLGGRVPEPEVMTRAMGACRMGAVLKAQMSLAAQAMAEASEAERDFLLTQLMQLALYACETATANLGERAPSRRDLLTSALSVIEQNLASPGLDAKLLQARLGCSRATLYRAFAKTGTSVSDTIARARMERAKALLAGSPDMPIGIVAARSGWYDSASFARAFRRHAQASPSEFREQFRIT